MRRCGDRGVVLLLTFIIMVTLAAITVAFMHMIAVRTKTGGYDLAEAKAFWCAEAGLQQALYQLKNDAGFRSSPTDVNGNLGSGSYVVTVAKDGDTYTLTCVGTVASLSRKIQQSAVVASAGPEAFNYAQHAGKDIKFEDSGGTVNGDISAVGQVKDEEDMTITGTITEGSGVATPSVDFDAYASIADHLVSGDQTFQEGQTYSGIWYVEGKVTLEDDVTINGSVIATKDIVVKKSEGLSLVADTGFPALVSGKSIKGEKLKDSSMIGLVYAAKDIDFDKIEDVTFQGSLIAVKKISMEEGEDFTVQYDADIQSNPPPYFSGGSGVTVTAQKDWDEVVPAS